MTRNELALANIRFLKKCLSGEQFSDFNDEDLLNIARCAKSLSYSRSTCKRLEALCETLSKHIEQKHSNPITRTTFFVLAKNEVQSIIEEIASSIYD